MKAMRTFLLISLACNILLSLVLAVCVSRTPSANGPTFVFSDRSGPADGAFLRNVAKEWIAMRRSVAVNTLVERDVQYRAIGAGISQRTEPAQIAYVSVLIADRQGHQYHVTVSPRTENLVEVEWTHAK